MITLPPVLQHAIRQLLHQIPSRQWSDAARQLSERYRAPRNGSTLVTAPIDAVAYTAMMLPATYAQIHRALRMCMPHVETHEWRSILDIGSGPGTALWVAHALMPSLVERTAIEREPAFVAVAKQLCDNLPGRTSYVVHDITATQSWAEHDVVIIGHVLNELSAPQRMRIIDAAWAATKQLLIIIEPGTSNFFSIIRDARQQLIDCGAQIVAPCTHNNSCPMTSPDWCHFGQKIARPDFQRHARAVSVGWEEAKVSFVAASRHATAQRGQRLVHDPVSHKGHIELMVCGAAGLRTTSVQKRDATAYGVARRLSWGDVWPE